MIDELCKKKPLLVKVFDDPKNEKSQGGISEKIFPLKNGSQKLMSFLTKQTLEALNSPVRSNSINDQSTVLSDQHSMDFEFDPGQTVSFQADVLRYRNLQESDPNSSKSKRTWLFYALFGCLLVLTGFLLFYFVAHPIVQSIMDRTTISIKRADLTDPTTSSFRLVAIAELQGDLPMNVVMKPASLRTYFGNETFGVMHTRLLQLSKSNSTLSFSGQLVVNNQHVYQKFSSCLATEANVSLTLAGLVHLQVLNGLLTFANVVFSQTLTLAAMENLGGSMEVQSFSVNLTADNLPLNTIVVSMVNPSSFVIEPLGNVSMAVFVQNDYIMTAHVPVISFSLLSVFSFDCVVVVILFL